MAVGHKPFTEIILGKKSLRKRNKSTRKLGPSQLGAARTSCSRSRFGSGQPGSAGLGSAAPGPGELGSSCAGSAWFREGLAQLIEFASAQARPGPAGPGQGVTRPGLAAKAVALCKQNKTFQQSRSYGDEKNQIYGGEKIPQNDWADLGSARIGPAPLQLRSARASRARLGSAWLTPAWACPTRPGLARLGFGTVWLGSARLGCSPPRQPIFSANLRKRQVNVPSPYVHQTCHQTNKT